MKINDYIPTPQKLAQETIVALASVVIAAWIISRFPTVKAFVKANSLTVNDQTGNPIL